MVFYKPMETDGVWENEEVRASLRTFPLQQLEVTGKRGKALPVLVPRGLAACHEAAQILYSSTEQLWNPHEVPSPAGQSRLTWHCPS